MRIQQSAAIAAIALGLSAAVSTQEPVDLAALDRIKSEAFARSEVMEHLRYLTDVHGPRLTGSPQFEDAAKWASERLTSYGLSNAHVERWPFGRSWSVEQSSAELLAPHYTRLAAMPLAWSASSAGPVTGEPMLTPLDLGVRARSEETRRGLRRLPQALDRKAARQDHPVDPQPAAAGPRDRAVPPIFRRRARRHRESAGTSGAATSRHAGRPRVAGEAGRRVQAVHDDAGVDARPAD